ncbi:MAG: glycerol kinase GlpK [Syntrophomonadaceae bacterium]|jgi:glycerol kinase|nr:glycerol kinase GlpK [Bacillota bacterium]NLM87890.1 glycerol kinase GlpK [Syntrophomonadaceae bacterium]HAA09313.1 glycerol kinase [Syntrophomonas sp.]HQA49727.1 glycerol kinase GlpK [Syntrophomonadaceae bacterium]HQD90531.1 glycerol kinase GlpK [Syntrophomonadaceae bacterium]
MSLKYILAIDQGTTGTTALLINQAGEIISRTYRDFTQIYPQPGWVEHDPQEIWAVTLSAVTQALLQANLKSSDIHAIGITNQRETTVVWDRETGMPIGNAIVWQCRRTTPICEEMKQAGWAPKISEKTGLVIDAYFSATKLAWILDSSPTIRSQAEAGKLLFGTIDSWLLWKLTGGKVHVTDMTNASRTMLYNIHQLHWDNDILSYFNIPTAMLPQVGSSSEIYGYSDPGLLGNEIPIAGLAGDQQAALFGQTCFEPGQAKNTYGTGCFLLMNTGQQAVRSQHGLLTTIAWSLNNKVYYALEGSIFIAGAAVQWLRDELKIINTAAETEALAKSLPGNDGVYLVPAFVGLGAPYWDMHARGTIMGLTRGTSRAHLARAALESIAYQTVDVLEAMQRDSGIALQILNVDGGASANNFLMQFQTDILGVPVERPVNTESTGIGAAYLAGLASGFWNSLEELQNMRRVDRKYVPSINNDQRNSLLQGWHKAVGCTLTRS